MKEFTQTAAGNCWQTGIACLLEVDPFELPDQTSLEAEAKHSFNNALQAYLYKHHGRSYHQLDRQYADELMVRDPGWHLMIGPTVRTSEPTNILHVVVGRYGEMIWDVHPSRAGLTNVTQWGIIYKPDAEAREWRNRMMKDSSTKMCKCRCPRCGR